MDFTSDFTTVVATLSDRNKGVWQNALNYLAHDLREEKYKKMGILRQDDEIQFYRGKFYLKVYIKRKGFISENNLIQDKDHLMAELKTQYPFLQIISDNANSIEIKLSSEMYGTEELWAFVRQVQRACETMKSQLETTYGSKIQVSSTPPQDEEDAGGIAVDILFPYAKSPNIAQKVNKLIQTELESLGVKYIREIFQKSHVGFTVYGYKK